MKTTSSYGLVFLIILISCNKIDTYQPISRGYGYVDTVSMITIYPNWPKPINNVIDSSIYSLNFQRLTALDWGDTTSLTRYQLIQGFSILEELPKYRIYYTADDPLIGDTVLERNQHFITYKINHKLKGKELFYIYDTQMKRVYYVIFASTSLSSVKIHFLGNESSELIAKCFNNSIAHIDSSLFGISY